MRELHGADISQFNGLLPPEWFDDYDLAIVGFSVEVVVFLAAETDLDLPRLDRLIRVGAERRTNCSPAPS